LIYSVSRLILGGLEALFGG